MIGYYARNKSKVLEYQKEYNALNKAKKSEYDKARREANKEKIREYKKDYRRKNREILLIKEKAFRENNKDKVNQQIKLAKSKNREKYNAISRAYAKTPKGAAIKASVNEKRRAAKKSAPISDSQAIFDWVKQWKSEFEVYCYWCKNTISPMKAHIDHVIPLARGGAHCLSNLVISCVSCNLRKGKKLPEEWLASR